MTLNILKTDFKVDITGSLLKDTTDQTKIQEYIDEFAKSGEEVALYWTFSNMLSLAKETYVYWSICISYFGKKISVMRPTCYESYLWWKPHSWNEMLYDDDTAYLSFTLTI